MQGPADNRRPRHLPGRGISGHGIPALISDQFVEIPDWIKFSDLTLSEVEKVLEFIYDGSVSFDNHHDFEQFIANALKLQLRRLPNFENGGAGVTPEPRLAEASSVNSSPPAKRQKSEEPLGSDEAKEANEVEAEEEDGTRTEPTASMLPRAPTLKARVWPN